MNSPRSALRPRFRLGLTEAGELAGLALLWLGLVLLIDPRGEFPLNDDWSYARTVKVLLETGRLEITGWTSPTLLAQMAWGWLASTLFGFSHQVLRVTGLIWGLVGAAGLYLLAGRLGAGRPARAAAALLLALDPLYLNLSCTFMTDVPFVALSLLALAGWATVLEERAGGGASGAAWAALAGLTRQAGLAWPLALAAACLWPAGLERATRRRAALAAALAAGVGLAGWAWLALGPGRPAELLQPLAEGLAAWEPGRLFVNLHQIVIYLGALAWPLLAGAWAADLAGADRAGRRGLWLSLALASLAVALPLLVTGRLMPLGRNVLGPHGLGPLTLADVYLRGLANYPSLPWPFWLAVTSLGVIGGGMALDLAGRALLAWRRGRSPAPDQPRLMVGLAGSIYLAALLALGPGFDRYLLPALALALALVAARPLQARALGWALAGWLILLGPLAVGGSHDYLAWNRARWAAAEYLAKEAGVGPAEADGGFEWGGWFNYDPAARPRPGKSWWWVQDDRFLLAFGPVPGYRQIRAFPFPRWLALDQGRVVALERVTGED